MQELSVRIRFTAPCLGNSKLVRTRRRAGKRKKSTVFLLPRNNEGRVVFSQSWWTIILRKAADILCHFQQDVSQIRFDRVVDGKPSLAEPDLYRRYYLRNQFSLHEAFAEGDVVGLSCVIPERISQDDFWRLLSTAGKFYGISPAKHGEFGFFEVVSLSVATGMINRASSDAEEESSLSELGATKLD